MINEGAMGQLMNIQIESSRRVGDC